MSLLVVAVGPARPWSAQKLHIGSPTHRWSNAYTTMARRNRLQTSGLERTGDPLPPHRVSHLKLSTHPFSCFPSDPIPSPLTGARGDSVEDMDGSPNAGSLTGVQEERNISESLVVAVATPVAAVWSLIPRHRWSLGEGVARNPSFERWFCFRIGRDDFAPFYFAVGMSI